MLLTEIASVLRLLLLIFATDIRSVAALASSCNDGKSTKHYAMFDKEEVIVLL